MNSAPGIGISWLWQLPETHPFYPAAMWHDRQYDLRAKGKLQYITSKPVDREFFRRCKRAAGNGKRLKVQAHLFYYLARAWGVFMWPSPATESGLPTQR